MTEENLPRSVLLLERFSKKLGLLERRGIEASTPKTPSVWDDARFSWASRAMQLQIVKSDTQKQQDFLTTHHCHLVPPRAL